MSLRQILFRKFKRIFFSLVQFFFWILFGSRRGMGLSGYGFKLRPCFGSKKRIFGTMLIICIIVYIFLEYSSMHISWVSREEELDERIAELNSRIQYLENQYSGKLMDLYDSQARFGNGTQAKGNSRLSSEVMELLRNMSGSRAAEAMSPRAKYDLIKTPFSLRLMPHLMENPDALRPAYHLQSNKNFVEYVIGIPHVKRDKENYVLTTLEHLIAGMDEKSANRTLIVVFVGETNLEYVLKQAYDIESRFPTEVSNGLIEVLSPNTTYYPDLDKLPLTLGDSAKRVKWRTKQNLDAIYLMAYASTKGSYYLMLEDDVVAKQNFMQDIKAFVSKTTVSNPGWFFINFSTTGGIGKLFRSSDLLHFITYVQLFYANMPIDWLLESYLADRICGIDKGNKNCGTAKGTIRPTFKTNLFQHIGLYSSLKGKIQKVKDKKYGSLPLFYPHDNPIVSRINSTIQHNNNFTIERAYKGETYFWGMKPQEGDVIEFVFEDPTNIVQFTFRSGNPQHTNDKFSDSVIEVLPARPGANYIMVGFFDEFGLADGKINPNHWPLTSLRIRVERDSKYWVILNEIHLQTG